MADYPVFATAVQNAATSAVNANIRRTVNLRSIQDSAASMLAMLT